jgi:hypothetical protein
MQVVTTDLLTDMCGLSPLLNAVIAAAGLVLCLFGWWSHRFWIVLAATVAAGVLGLSQAAALRTPALPVAVLMSLAAGVLALSLIRVAVFLAAGLSFVLICQQCLPTLNQPVIVFLTGGLVCHVLFRLCLTTLTSLAGAVLLLYPGLALVHKYAGVDVLGLSERTPGMFNWGCLLLAGAGFTFQVYCHRRALRRQEGEEESKPGLLRLPRVFSWSDAERNAA